MQERKLVGLPKPGSPIRIFWQGVAYTGIIDHGYCFRLPICDRDESMHDLFVHIPHPNNSGGIGDAPEEYKHLNDLLSNKYVSQIEVLHSMG